MDIITVKACPLLGVHIVKASVIEKASGMCDINETFECMGEDCINFAWDDEDGYCRYFQRYTNHDRRKRGEEE